MDDLQALQLLRLLHEYATNYEGDDLRISELADDLVASMNVTTVDDLRLRDEIKRAVSK